MRTSACVCLLLSTVACSGSSQAVLTADLPLHLEDHLEAATFTALAAPNGPTPDAPQAVEWRFDQPQPDWKATPQRHPAVGPARLSRTDDGLRVSLGPGTDMRKVDPNGTLVAGIHVDLPDWKRADWAEVVIRARAGPKSPVAGFGVRFDLRNRPDQQRPPVECLSPYQFLGESSAVVADDRIHTYRFRAVPLSPTCTQGAGPGDELLRHPWRQLALWFWTAGEPGSIDLLSVTVVPKGAVVPPSTIEWRFDQPQPDWKPVLPNPAVKPALAPARIERTTDALRVTLPEGSRQADQFLHGGIYIDLPGWRREEWAHVIVRARTTTVTDMTLGRDPRQGAVPPNAAQATFQHEGGTSPVVSDGSVQTYQIRPDWGRRDRTGTWLRVGFDFRASEPGFIDILSVSVVPIGVLYASDRPTSRMITFGTDHRRTLVTHAPGRVEYRLRVPEGGRLQTSLGVLNAPVEFRVTVQKASGEATTVFRETQADPLQWAPRTVDLSSFAGQVITLGVEASAQQSGTVVFWGSPVVSGSRTSASPNVILYVIDGGWADDMSVYGYNRRTTPNLERLAAEGALFEHAYSNSSSTKPSTASFMTSLHASVLGFTGDRSDPLPENAVTMAERFHRAGYQTAVLTANPNAATGTGLQRWADFMHEPPVQNDIISSARLNSAFWNWREGSSGQPYWAHFQATDVHAYEGRNPVTVVPFSGTFVAAQRRREFFEEWERQNRTGVRGWTPSLQAAGIDRVAFFETMRALYDESLAHQDYQIGQLVGRLRERGEWEKTLLIIAGDHAIAAALRDLGTLVQTNPPPAWNNALLRSSITRVPLIFVWPGRIAGGQRFEAPVSMIDLLPTVLDLADLPMPEVMQGQSLAPLLRGQPGWTRRPVILEGVDAPPGQPQRGRIEVIDGRWGASLQIGPESESPEERRPWPLLLYDVWADPLALRPVNEQYPDLVKKYTEFLEDTWKGHQLLARQYKPGPKVTLTPEQLERLRSLGYIR